MATTKQQQHLDKAKHNEYLVETLDNPFWDWAMTGTFYAALHYVEAYFCKYPPASSIPSRENHEKRDSNIKRDARLSTIYNDYRELKTESEDARYRPWISPSHPDVQRVQKHLQAIRKIVIAAL